MLSVVRGSSMMGFCLAIESRRLRVCMDRGVFVESVASN